MRWKERFLRVGLRKGGVWVGITLLLVWAFSASVLAPTPVSGQVSSASFDFSLLGIGQTLRSVSWADEATAYVVGDNGFVGRYSGGVGVTPLPTGLTVNLLSIDWNTRRGFGIAVGESGTALLVSQDGTRPLTKVSSQTFNKVVWSPDGRVAVILGASGTIITYEADSELLTQVASPRRSNMKAAVWKEDSSGLLLAGDDALLELDLRANQVIDVTPKLSMKTVSDVAILQDGRILIAGSQLWLLEDQPKVLHAQPVARLAARGDEIYVLSGRQILLYTEGSLSRLAVAIDVDGTDMEWNPTGDRALITTAQGGLVSFDGERLRYLTILGAEPTLGISARPGGGLAGAGKGGKIWMYDGQEIRTIRGAVKDDIYDIEWHTSGTFATVVGSNGLIAKFDGLSLEVISSGRYDNLRTISWRPGGDYALIGGDRGTVLRFDGSTVTRLDFTGAGSVRGIAWRTGGGKALLVGDGGLTYEFDGRVFVKLNATGLRGSLLDASENPGGCVVLVAGDRGFLALYDGRSFKAVRTSEASALRTISWRPDGAYALVAGDKGAVLSLTADGSSSVNPPVSVNWGSSVWPTATREVYLASTGPQETVLKMVEKVAPVPSFEVSPAASLSLQAGSQGRVVFNLTSVNGFTGKLRVSVRDGGGQVAMSLPTDDPLLKPFCPTAYVASLTVPEDTPPGQYRLTVVFGDSGSGVERTVTVVVTEKIGEVEPFSLGYILSILLQFVPYIIAAAVVAVAVVVTVRVLRGRLREEEESKEEETEEA